MLAERRTVEERVGVDLADGFCGSPTLALGMVGIEEQAADAVFRLKYANDPKAFSGALKAVSGIAKSLDNRHNWRIKGHTSLANAVLQYWLCDVCPSCTGIGARAITGTPVLDGGCPACHGSGKRDYPWRNEGRSAQYHTLVLIALEEAERRIRGKLIDKLAHQIRDANLLG